YLLVLTFYNGVTNTIHTIHAVYALNVNLKKAYSITGILTRNKIYYHGGLQMIGVDDFVTNSLPSSNIINSFDDAINSNFFSFPYNNAFHVTNNQLYFFGGRLFEQADDGETIFGRYDVQNHKWEFFQNSSEFPFRLEDHSCAMTNNGLFVIFGGKSLASGTTNYSNDIYITNFNSEHWGSSWIKPSFIYGPGSRTFHSATILPDGRMVVLGGQTNDSIFVPMSEIWVYDININEWQDI
ncbi:20194_t:CDS:2, partial [Racocetra persica]